MPDHSEQLKAQQIDKVIGRIHERVQGEVESQVEQFSRRYYASVAAEDLTSRSVLNLYGAALAHWNLLHRRLSGETLVRVYNPDYEQHGWESTHTIIEVVNDDMPFLVDSALMVLNRQHLNVHFLIHPVLAIERNMAGELVRLSVRDELEQDFKYESLIHIEIDRQPDQKDLLIIEGELLRVFEDVRLAVTDWKPVCARMQQVIDEILETPPPLQEDEVREDVAFLQWMLADQFVFLGYREYLLATEGEGVGLQNVEDSGLGILRNAAGKTMFQPLPPKQLALARTPQLLILTKTNALSTVHRSSHLDYVGIKRFDADGQVIGEYRFLGLYTSIAYTSSPRSIPLLRRKVAEVMQSSGLSYGSHAGKALVNIVEMLPRDELFQSPIEDLIRICMGILEMHERPRVRVFVRLDTYERFASCLVFVPRDRYTTHLRLQIEEMLMTAFNGSSSEFNTLVSESMQARVHFIIRVPAEGCPPYRVADLETQLQEIVRSWQDSLFEGLIEHLGEGLGNRYYHRYADAFPAGYREEWSVQTAISDLQHIEALTEEDSLEMSFYRPLEAPVEELHFKLFRRLSPIPLSEALPVLECMGLKVIGERPFQIMPAELDTVWVHDFIMVSEQVSDLDPEQLAPLFQETFLQVWRGEMESDGFNRLVLMARLSWRETTLLRAYCKYLLQAGSPFSQSYMEQTLNNNPKLARLLIELFHCRFNPEQHGCDETRNNELMEHIDKALDEVANLDEDRILRRFYATLRATLRCNYYQQLEGGGRNAHLAFKFDPARIPDLPLPKPHFEVFVYSPRVEGVHLRGGAVARGGLRWSDRKEDYRTEILGLMKAQMVKNSIIVPVGAKGGFVSKCLPVDGGGEAVAEEVLACYRIFIHALLDITDNLDGDLVIPAAGIVRYDGDDPYLVVAADKGTATFSDVANKIAIGAGFWLGDAFASGGKAGYDHKKIGITARGAWESVKRHFREGGEDIQQMHFTAVGIGDMSGDVFGNGMLLSSQLRLVAAFDHRHIFFDPQPDLQASLEERRRLFGLSRSTWMDYNPKLISAGGGVFSRTAKTIEISPEMRRTLAIEDEHMEPNALIRAILKAPVDLLWNGGVGTYVKSAEESHEDAGDRANDAVRINGSEMRCLVVGEGGNLGFTQRGRIEYASKGGRINTDFIDNSGGVDCSDREVNIKILLDRVVTDGELTIKQRNRLLDEMTDEVAEQVLQDNYRQSLSLTLTEVQASRLLVEHLQFIYRLERAGRLDRELEKLPDDEEMLDRQTNEVGLTRPEMAVLLCYGKLLLKDELLTSGIPDDPCFLIELERFFPSAVRERFAERISSHRLRREIISTQVTNEILNRMGATFVHRLQTEAGASAAEVTRAFFLARAVFGLGRLWNAIDNLDNNIPAQTQIHMILQCNRLVIGGAFWFLRYGGSTPHIEELVVSFRPGIKQLTQLLFSVLAVQDLDADLAKAKGMMDSGVPKELAVAIAGMDHWLAGLDIVETATESEADVEIVAKLYFLLDDRLGLHWLRKQVVRLSTESHWHTQARAALREELRKQQATLTAEILSQTSSDMSPEERVESWCQQHQHALERWQQLVADLKGTNVQHFEMLMVAVRELREMVSRTGAIDIR